MRIRRAWAVAVAIAILLAPLSAMATSWEDWKFLIRKRPVAVFFAIPLLVVTSPFMGASWLAGKASGSGDSSAESDDEDGAADPLDQSGVVGGRVGLVAGVVRGRLQCCHDRLPQRGVERVARLRPIEPEQQHAVSRALGENQ